MAGCKRCALKRRIREREKKRKEKEKGGKMGIKIVFFFFISPRAGFFHMRYFGNFFKYLWPS